MNFFRRIVSWIIPSQLEKTRGELGHDLEVNIYNGKLLLDSGKVNYSFGSLQEVFDHAFEKTGLYDAPVDSALILGFGSGSVAELLLNKCNPEMKITGVEADAEVIRLAKKYFPVTQNKNVQIIHHDAAAFPGSTNSTFDLIVVDVFLEDVVPASCQATEFLHRLKSLLNQNGKLYFNKMQVVNDPVTLETFEQRLREVFGKINRIQLSKSGGQNSIFYN